jgi:hypothetical protein
VRSSRVALILVLAAILVSGNSAFAQRPPPLTGGFDIEEVLTELSATLKARDWRRYRDFLTPDFRFTPYHSVVQEYPTVIWDEWDRDREIAFIRELVDPHYSASLKLRDQILDRGQESHGRAEWDLVYTLDGRGGTFKSRAILVFEKIDNLWYLREWIDTTIESDKETGKVFQTSGSLRGMLSR